MTRSFKRLICRCLVGVMLFAQLAVAAYACPALSRAGGQLTSAPAATAERRTMSAGDTGDDAATTEEARMMNCDQMAGSLDKAAPNLCAEHCRHGQQSDQAHPPSTPATTLVSLYIVSPMQQALLPIRSDAASVDLLAAAGPPLAILHCRFRD